MTQGREVFGVWLLHSFVLEDIESRERTEPFGPNPRGTIIFLPEGRMVALLTPTDQVATTSEAEQAIAFQKLIAYSGLYKIELPDRLVTNVDIAWFPAWVGTEQVRFFRCGGDTLDIVSAPTVLPRRNGGAMTVVGTLSWKRESRFSKNSNRTPNRQD